MADDVADRAKALDIKGAMVSMVITAFGLVAALFWQDAIKQLIAELVPKGEGLVYSFAAAVLVTLIAVAAIWLVSKYMSASAKIGRTMRENAKKLAGANDGA